MVDEGTSQFTIVARPYKQDVDGCADILELLAVRHEYAELKYAPECEEMIHMADVCNSRTSDVTTSASCTGWVAYPLFI